MGGGGGGRRVFLLPALRLQWLLAVLLVVSPSAAAAAAEEEVESQCRRPPVIFNFGDSNSDTGGLQAGLGYVIGPPHGRRFPGGATGRLCDGRLIIDFLCQSHLLRLLRLLRHRRTELVSVARHLLLLLLLLPESSSDVGRCRRELEEEVPQPVPGGAGLGLRRRRQLRHRRRRHPPQERPLLPLHPGLAVPPLPLPLPRPPLQRYAAAAAAGAAGSPVSGGLSYLERLLFYCRFHFFFSITGSREDLLKRVQLYLHEYIHHKSYLKNIKNHRFNKKWRLKWENATFFLVYYPKNMYVCYLKIVFLNNMFTIFKNNLVQKKIPFMGPLSPEICIIFSNKVAF